MNKEISTIRITTVFVQIVLGLQYLALGIIVISLIARLIFGTLPGSMNIEYPVLGQHIEETIFEWKGKTIPVKMVSDGRTMKVPADKLGVIETAIPLLTASTLLGLTIFVSIQLLRFIKSVKDNEVFTLTNIQRLQKIALVFFIAAIVFPFYQMMAHYIMQKPEMHFEPDFDYIFYGLFLFIISVVLKKGLEMKAENELTI